MKLDFTSDTHLDFWIKNTTSENIQAKVETFTHKVICANGGDVFVLAGDIGHYHSQNSVFLKYLKSLYNHVLVVPGNHDRYLVSKTQQQKYSNNSENRISELSDFCSENSIHFLDGNTVQIEDITFGGVGMSWDTSYIESILGRTPNRDEIISLFRRTMNDSSLMFSETDFYDVYSSYNFGYENKRTFDAFSLFKTEIEKLSNIQKADIMVTHYAPCVPKSLPFKYQGDKTSTFFFFDGKEDIKRINSDLWIFGHTHHKYNFRLMRTEFMCSPLGYPSENNLGSVVSLDEV